MLTKSNHHRSNLLVAGILLSLIVSFSSCISLDKMLSVGSNKSIIGLTGAVISNLNRNENAGIFLLKGSNNVIIRNLTLLGPGAYDIDANYSDNISAVGACRKRQRRMRLKIIVAARTSTSKSWTVWE